MSQLQIHLKTQYCDSLVVLKQYRYSNNDRIALIAEDPNTGEVLMKLSVNLPDENLAHDHICIKSYGENAGALECLIEHGIVSLPLDWVILPHTNIAICQLLV